MPAASTACSMSLVHDVRSLAGKDSSHEPDRLMIGMSPHQPTLTPESEDPLFLGNESYGRRGMYLPEIKRDAELAIAHRGLLLHTRCSRSDGMAFGVNWMQDGAPSLTVCVASPGRTATPIRQGTDGVGRAKDYHSPRHRRLSFAAVNRLLALPGFHLLALENRVEIRRTRFVGIDRKTDLRGYRTLFV